MSGIIVPIIYRLFLYLVLLVYLPLTVVGHQIIFRGMETKAIAALISQARAGINRFLGQELEKLGIKGLSPSHGSILAHLFTNGRVTMTALARAVRRDKSTVTTLVGKLVAHGYVRKVHCENDQRAIYVSLTAQGEALKPAFDDISNRLLARLWYGINVDEQEEMVRIMKKIISNFSAPNPGA